MIYVGESYVYVLLCFIVSGLTFRYLIHFEFIFVYGVRECSSFILLQGVDQFSQHHFLKWLSFFSLYILTSFVKDKVSVGSWIYLWAFYSLPLTYISVFVPVPYCLDDCDFVVYSLKLGRLIPPVPFFLKVTLAIRGFLYFHTNCEIICSSSVKNTVGSLIGLALNL